jgi:hypothetical protein
MRTVCLLLAAASPVLAGEAEYAAELKTAGNSVRLEGGHIVALTFKNSEPLTDADYQRIGGLTRLKSLTFYGKCLMTDDQAAAVGKLAALEELAVNGTRLTDDGFKHLGKLSNLRKLIFWHLGWQGVKLTGSGFAHLASCPKLETFGFAGSTVGDEALEALTKVPQLQSVIAYHTRVTDAGLEHLMKLPRLTAIDLGPQFSMRLGDAGLATLARIPTLESITYGETALTYEGSLKGLKGLKSLKAVKLELVDISETDLERLKADLPAVTIDWKAPSEAQAEQMRKRKK